MWSTRERTWWALRMGEEENQRSAENQLFSDVSPSESVFKKILGILTYKPKQKNKNKKLGDVLIEVG